MAPMAAVALGLIVWGTLNENRQFSWLGTAIAMIAFLTLLFFRDPERHPPADPRAVVSPADGKVIVAEILADGRKHVAVFLSVFDVHVNRTPIGGEATKITVTPGAYFHAGTLKAADENARVDVEATTTFGTVAWRQTSGAIARKISCRLKSGDRFQTGERFGLIYFGSRMDVFLPSSATLVTTLGTRVRAGESAIATF